MNSGSYLKNPFYFVHSKNKTNQRAITSQSQTNPRDLNTFIEKDNIKDKKIQKLESEIDVKMKKLMNNVHLKNNNKKQNNQTRYQQVNPLVQELQGKVDILQNIAKKNQYMFKKNEKAYQEKLRKIYDEIEKKNEVYQVLEKQDQQIEEIKKEIQNKYEQLDINKSIYDQNIKQLKIQISQKLNQKKFDNQTKEWFGYNSLVDFKQFKQKKNNKIDEELLNQIKQEIQSKIQEIQ